MLNIKCLITSRIKMLLGLKVSFSYDYSISLEHLVD